MRLSRFMFLLCAALALCGCRDMVELEDRAFAGAIAIDLDREAGFSAGAEILALQKDMGEAGNERDVRRSKGGTTLQALLDVNSRSSKAVYYGLGKVCLFGEELLKDGEALRRAVDSLERNGEFNAKMVVLAARGDAVRALEKETGEASLSTYVMNFYQNNRGFPANAARINLEGLSRALSRGGGAVLGLLECGDGGLFLSGAAVIAGGRLAGFADNRELRGLMWVKDGTGALARCRYNNAEASMRADKTAVRYEFREEGGGLGCVIRVSVWGVAEEYAGGELGPEELTELEGLFAEVIAEEVRLTYDALAGYGTDAYGIMDRLQKTRPALYDKYGADWGGISVTADASVTIHNSGFKR